ncbi:hypothetical protein QEN19_002798 [Hanseniaspora menglaensis]
MISMSLILRRYQSKVGRYLLKPKAYYNSSKAKIGFVAISKKTVTKQIKRGYSNEVIKNGRYVEYSDIDDNMLPLTDFSDAERLLDFESKLNVISGSLLLNADSNQISQDQLNKYWKDLIIVYETECNFYDQECNLMDLIVLRQYLNIGLRTNVFDLKYSDMLSKFIHLITIIKAGTNRDFAIGMNDLKLRQNKQATELMAERVETRLISIFKEFLKFLEFVPLKQTSQDISINFFYIIFLRLLNESENRVTSNGKVTDIKMKMLNFFRSEMSKKKNILQPTPTAENSFMRQLQVNNFNSLSIDENINTWDMDSIRALQKCMIYRVIRTQDPEIISNFWDNFNFRSVFFKNNIMESWFVFIEQMEIIFKRENVTLSPYMKNYIKNELLVTLEHDLISISEMKMKKGQILIGKLNQFVL